MVWKIVLKHKENPWTVEIIGVGEDPHNPAELIIRSNTRLPSIRKIIEELKTKVEHPPEQIPADILKNKNDLYLWQSVVYTFTALNPDWKMEDNLPELKIEEDEEIRELKDRGITPIF